MHEFEYLGPYELGEVIGRGGMGTIYAATHATSGEQVALKLIAQHLADDPRFRRRFNAEIETLRRLRHPGIVRLIGYGEEANCLFYAMELVHGESLQQRIRDVKRMSWIPAVDIAIQVTSALKHAHDIGVIHRDLKPANLLLTTANEVKVVDFGIAKLFGYGDQTLAGSVLGTADYMAPEQAGEGPITPRTDLYALGSVMYAMMAGRPPFSGKKTTQVIDALKRDRAIPLDLINPEIPREVVAIVHDLLEKAPQDRPPTAIAVNKRLKATRAGLQRGGTVSVQSEVTQNEPIQSEPIQSDGAAQAHFDTEQSYLTDGLVVDEIRADRGTDAADEKTSITAASTPPVSSSDSLSRGDHGGTATTQSPNANPAGAPGARSPVKPTETPPNLSTTFQTVEQDETDSIYFRGDAAASPVHHWLQVASLATMLAILIGGIYLFIRASRVPSADSIFQTLQQADHDNELTLNEALIDRFLVHYPDDEHVAQVRQWKQQADLERTLKRLSAQARRLGGTANLNPAAQAFINAIELRTSSRQQARQKLQAWLDVFTDDGMTKETSASEREPIDPLIGMDHLTRLVREELRRLNDQDTSTAETDSRIEMLRSRIRASETMETAEREKLLRGLIELYDKVSWARPIVDEAATMLARPADTRSRADDASGI